MRWDPDLYLTFRDERLAPFEDLRQLIVVREHLRVIDLGCGTGELTERLADLLPASEVLGIDSSEPMLVRARERARPGLRFEQGRIEDQGGEWDLVFSNAALHWIEDHEALVPRLFGLLRPGGQMVVQIPSNHGHPAHRAVVEVARVEPFRGALGGWTRTSPVLPLPAYAELLHAAGGIEIHALEKVYPHVLPDYRALAEFTRGTTLLPYLERLPEGLGPAFLAAYGSRLAGLYPHGPVFHGFRRILLAASRRPGR